MTTPSDNPSKGSAVSRAVSPRGETLFEWPHCPACGAARSAQCPACKTEGTTWEQAFGPPAARFDDRVADDGAGALAPSSIAVICPTCDEVFEPVFARRCAVCRRDLSVEDAAATKSGRYLSGDRATSTARRDMRHTARMILAALAAAAVAYTLYDWLLSNSGGSRLF